MISVALATHNEAKNLERCLLSVKGIADEIVIVDGESTDDTVAITRKFGAKIINTTNKANFHINKQMALDAVSGQLVLQLDADEEVDDELKKFILKTHQEILQRSPDDNLSQPVAWYLKRKNLFLGHFF